MTESQEMETGGNRLETVINFDCKDDYAQLSPHMVLNAIEQQGFACNGSLFELNSYENRVYQIGIENEAPIIAKFYRPNRWSKAQLLEEHKFTLELEAEEIPAIAPMVCSNTQKTLFEHENYLFALYKRQGGYAPELSIPEHVEIIGRTLARIHSLGSIKPYEARGGYDFDAMGAQSAHFILEHFIPREYAEKYSEITTSIFSTILPLKTRIEKLTYLRSHGDCHVGNILWQNEKPFFVDFDDSINAPQVSDIWMLLDKQDENFELLLDYFLEGYSCFYDFNPVDLKYCEVFRTLRMINYVAWVATRWGDPAFQRNFTWLNALGFWESHINDLSNQLKKLIEI